VCQNLDCLAWQQQLWLIKIAHDDAYGSGGRQKLIRMPRGGEQGKKERMWTSS
jgi:hypothetical protein